jgi:hypothetical protein
MIRSIRSYFESLQLRFKAHPAYWWLFCPFDQHVPELWCDRFWGCGAVFSSGNLLAGA